MFTAIITGANGYIGRNLIKKYKKKINFIIYKEDINNIKKISDFILKNDFEIFIHLAGLLRSSKKSKKEIYRTNSFSLKYISKEVSKKNKKLIFISSSHVYKIKKTKLKENDKLKPTSIYGSSKLKAENLIIKNIKKYCILRLFNLYGDYMPKGSFFSDIKSKIINKKKIIIDKSVRDFVHIDDICKLIFFVCKKNINGIFNASSGLSVSLVDIINFFEKKYNQKCKLLIKKTKTCLVGSNAKIKAKGFKFKYKNIFDI